MFGNLGGPTFAPAVLSIRLHRSRLQAHTHRYLSIALMPKPTTDAAWGCLPCKRQNDRLWSIQRNC
jgi:hypothetical protein